MKMEQIVEKIKSLQTPVSKVIYLVTFIIVGVLVFDIFAFVVTPDNIEQSIETAKEKYQLEDEVVKGYQKKYTDAAEKLKKENSYMPKPKKPKQPVCTGVIGSKAFINGKLYAVGESVLGAKILDINPTGATIMWDGKELPLPAFAKVNISQPTQASGPKDATRHRVEEAPKARKGPGGNENRRGSGRGGFMGMSREQMEETRNKFMNMSSEERQKFIEERRRDFGGRGGPGGR